jgi:enamine deaminase RidA (YjgF/YER057c/UK114 family)
MPRVMLNGQDYVVQPTPLNWSELLTSLDRDLEPRGFLVTAIRLDGVDQPGFRDEGRLAGTLGRDAVIEVDASTPEDLLEDGLREAARSVTQLRQAAIALAAGYRQTDVTEANTHLATFADTLANLMALVAAAGQAMQVRLDDIRVDEMPASAVIRHLNNTIEALLEAHAARDWVTLADVLEHDLAPLMPSLGAVIDALVPKPR